MYPSTLYFEGQRYPSAEHAFQAVKSLDLDDRIAMSVCRSPEEAKKAGRVVNLRPDWEDVKVGYMHNILRAKFEDPELAQQLRDTGDAQLIEGNSWGDTFWGMCNGEGQNTLGTLLMLVRKEISE